MNMEPPLEASPKEKFDTLFGLLKDHYAGLFDFEFKNVTVLTLLLGWTLASNDARSFLHTHRGIAYCACVVVLLYAALLLISIWKFYRRSLLAYAQLSELGYMPTEYFRMRRIQPFYGREFHAAELGRSLSDIRGDSLHLTNLEKWPNHALQRTAPRVTLVAAGHPAACAHPDPHRLRPQPERAALRNR